MENQLRRGGGGGGWGGSRRRITTRDESAGAPQGGISETAGDTIFS